MLILKSIKLVNFLSHEKTEINLKENQKLLIDGKSGSGKSSLVEAILWGLYGKGRTSNRAIIKKGKKKAIVTIRLIGDKEHYKIIRSVTTKGKQTLELRESKDGVKYVPAKTNGLKETQTYLEKDILHSSYTLFVNSVIYPQENTENFVRQTASKRKDLILEMVNADSFADYLKKTKAELKERELGMAGKKERVKRSKEIIDEENEKGYNIDACKKKIEETREKIAENDLKKARNDEKRAENTKIEYKIGTIDHEISELVDSELVFDVELGELNKKYIETSKIDVEKVKAKMSQIKEFEEKLVGLDKKRDAYLDWQKNYNEVLAKQPVDYGLKAKIDELNKQIIEIQKEEIELCPELKKICPLLDKKRQERVNRKSEQLSQLTEENNEYEQKVLTFEKLIEPYKDAPVLPTEQINAYKAKIRELEEYREQYSAVSGIEATLKSTQDRMEEINATITKNKEIRINKQTEKDTLTKELKTDELNAERNELLVESTKLQAINDKNIMELTQAEQSKSIKARAISTMKKSLDKMKVDEELIDGLSILKEAFGPNGLKTIVIEYVLPRLEDKINFILDKLSDFRVKLETQKNTTSTETVIEGLFITIINDMGEELDFDNYSGGERLKIIVAISEALSEIQKVGFRVLDELFVGLDEESTEQFAEVMAELQQRFKQLICISHLRNIKDMFNEKVELVKVDGTSKII